MYSAAYLRLFKEEAVESGHNDDAEETGDMSDSNEYDDSFIDNRPVEDLPTYEDSDMEINVCRRYFRLSSSFSLCRVSSFFNCCLCSCFSSALLLSFSVIVPLYSSFFEVYYGIIFCSH